VNSPSFLLVAIDESESQTIQDEFDGQSRWDLLCRCLKKAEPAFQRLRDSSALVAEVTRWGLEATGLDVEHK
jgi:hypothetical protein